MRSGSLSTADMAVEQGKFLFCVPPHDIFDKRYAGVMPLLRDGALPLFSHRDVLYELYTGHPQRLKLLDMPDYQGESLVFADDIQRIEDRIKSEKRAEEKAAKQMKQPMQSEEISPAFETPTVSPPQDGPLPEAESEREIVLFLREHGDTHINDMAAALDMDLSSLLSSLTMLELDGYVETLLHRRRALPELTASNFVTRSFGERVALNMPIQGTAADVMKLAMVRVDKRLREEKLRAKLILQVHDELIVECPEEEAERVSALLTEEMQSVAQFSVPLTAEAHSGKNWLEAKE